jgi:hypothetical protein
VRGKKAGQRRWPGLKQGAEVRIAVPIHAAGGFFFFLETGLVFSPPGIRQARLFKDGSFRAEGLASRLSATPILPTFSKKSAVPCLFISKQMLQVLTSKVDHYDLGKKLLRLVADP